MELGQVPECYLKSCPKAFTGFYNVLSRNIYLDVEENYDKPRRSYSITRSNKKTKYFQNTDVWHYGRTWQTGR
jgi:hypothetical protein